MSERRPASYFNSEKRAAFAKKVRTEYLLQGRDQKDAERARMEAYRKLCAEEGIQSQRLMEYDAAKQAASQELSKQLEAVDYDQSLTNNEKKRKKFSLKRKYAATSVSDIIDKSKKKYNAVTAAEKIGKARIAKKEASIADIKKKEKEKKNCIAARKAKNKLYSQRTRKGQPILASRVESLLQKIEKIKKS